MSEAFLRDLQGYPALYGLGNLVAVGERITTIFYRGILASDPHKKPDGES